MCVGSNPTLDIVWGCWPCANIVWNYMRKHCLSYMVFVKNRHAKQSHPTIWVWVCSVFPLPAQLAWSDIWVWRSNFHGGATLWACTELVMSTLFCRLFYHVCVVQYNTVARFCTACVHMSYPHAHHPLFLIFLLTVFVDGATYKSGSTSALSINRGCKLLLSKNYKWRKLWDIYSNLLSFKSF